VKQLTLPELLEAFPNSGELMWIGLRPARQVPMLIVNEVMVNPESGLAGDRYNGRSRKRQVTLLQWEYLSVLQSLTGRCISPELLRRNLAIRGINLQALKNSQFRIGGACFQATGLCHPCSRMEQLLGDGGYNAMRGHGGLTAEIISSGLLRLGDRVTVIPKRDV
jgi:MOSC domain-containing protein YiiM